MKSYDNSLRRYH